MRLLPLYLWALCSMSLEAQVSSNYWSHQFGARGQLLNGAVVSSVNDETAIYYNPGAFALYAQSGLSLSLVSPSYTITRTTDYLGDGTSFLDRRAAFAPGLVAAAFKPFKTDRVVLGVTSLTRYQSSTTFNDRVVNRLNEDQLFIGQLQYTRRLREDWLGAAISWEPTDKLAVGVSHFATFRGESIRLAFKKEIVDPAQPNNLIQSWRNDTDFRYRVDGGLITKLGIIWNPGQFVLGLTYTTGLRGAIDERGRYAVDDQKVALDGSTDVTSNIINQGIRRFRPPSSIGGGITIESGISEVSISFEYFSDIPTYTLFEATDDPYDGQSSVSDPTIVSIKQSANEVLNIAVGVKRRYAADKDLYLGFRTDLSPDNFIDFGESIAFLANSPDIFHLSVGVARRYLKSQFSVGLDYGGGVRRGGEQLTNLTTVQSENLFNFSGDPVVDTYVHEISLFITYDL